MPQLHQLDPTQSDTVPIPGAGKWYKAIHDPGNYR